jgi:hypothetical protein
MIITRITKNKDVYSRPNSFKDRRDAGQEAELSNILPITNFQSIHLPLVRTVLNRLLPTELAPKWARYGTKAEFSNTSFIAK